MKVWLSGSPCIALVLAITACSSAGETNPAGTGGSGATNQGGASAGGASTIGSAGTGGASGATSGSGAASGSAAANGSGGVHGSGGATVSGSSGAGGASSAAGGPPSGGGAGVSGATGAGGTNGAGGAATSGGTTGAGGTTASGGAGGTGANTGGASSFWPSGTDGISRTFADAFGTWRGRPVTSNWINVHWVSWDWLTTPGFYATLDGTNPIKLWDYYKGWNGIIVLSASMAGPDSSTNYDQNMRDCANGAYDTDWQTFATNAANAGRTGTNTVISLAHEFNGTWFKWNPGNVGIEVWTSCWKHVYTAIHAKSSLRVAWVLSASSNTKKGGDYSVNTAWDAYPGDAYVDVVGINRYDFKSLSSATTTNWKDTCSNTQDVCYAANYARQHKKQLGVPEWSMDRGQYGYGDLPAFVELMFGFFRDNADILAFENNFNNGGSGDWNFYPESSINMNSAEKYKQLWKQ